MNTIKLYLIRHGKTYCNEKKLYSGKTDVELSENGIKELHKKAESFKYPECVYYFTSGAKRANKTIEILCPNKKYDVLKKLFEYNFGDFELKSYNDLKDKKEYIDWINDEEGSICCPNGESRAQFKTRIREGFSELVDYLRDNNIKTALGVTHGGTIGIILETLYDSSKRFYEWQPKNGDGYELTISLESNDKDDEFINFSIDEVKKIGE
ncbi:histidine phosphatase family protein [Clostridium sp. SM-530-WT-3G]|uniref:histidine phosphatase family protein n=1 Tax=Clostridium sp. SM-530-WT-3G TaxID=2725303 RepID=UPI00145EDCDE|nr:histidine phosphatase family protein [Clostridium sp. SM-530-WT-3G]NME81921.1 histidine phosphatase family protein [Clostridium sp. SM-530-WT-3G]